MGERLRSVEQGADTVVWLALSRVAARTRSGQFFQGEQREILTGSSSSVSLCGFCCRHLLVTLGLTDFLCVCVCVADRQAVAAHLPLAWSHSSSQEIQGFMSQLEALFKAVQSQPDPEVQRPLSPSTPQFV